MVICGHYKVSRVGGLHLADGRALRCLSDTWVRVTATAAKHRETWEKVGCDTMISIKCGQTDPSRTTLPPKNKEAFI